ncbi:uncharacterized protein G2W53_024544 [Senna tora]|uniref:Uncharacterized protein n=1 Tax=Senna tora TaxID=362788 RepID=A0A834TKA3_9FABA|nr:uncharacterized protein G2W53_024544 [Senna tora]
MLYDVMAAMLGDVSLLKGASSCGVGGEGWSRDGWRAKERE